MTVQHHIMTVKHNILAARFWAVFDMINLSYPFMLSKGLIMERIIEMDTGRITPNNFVWDQLRESVARNG